MEHKSKTKEMMVQANGANVKKEESKTQYKLIEYEEFVLWSALPPDARVRMGIEHQYQFAEHYNVAGKTLTAWKDRPDYEKRVRALRKKWAFDKTGDVIFGIYKAAVKGNDKSQKLWMQVFEDFTEKQDVQHTLKVEVSISDIRYLIEALPVTERQIHYDNLRDLLIAADKAKRAGEFEDGSRDYGLETEVQEQADIDAPDVPDNRGANAIPRRHSTSVCADMGNETRWATPTSPYNNKSTAWWW